MKKRLVILSVPFQRLNRLLLGSPVVNALTENADILIVSPFGDDAAYQREFGNDSIRFLAWEPNQKAKPFFRKLYDISEIMRIQGYWRRNRKKGMGYFLANNNVEYGANGKDMHMSGPKHMIFDLLSIIGVWKGAWKLVDKGVGRALFDFSELRSIAKEYDEVSLVQSASWGIQDRMLAWMGKQEKWRTVMLPYTTDQLYSNGYLMSDFSAICVQGPVEYEFAKKLHKISDSKLVKLGSGWLRHIEALCAELDNGEIPEKSKTGRTIMYAGVSNIYFPLQSQFEIVDELLKENQTVGPINIIIRPVVNDDAERNEWAKRYAENDKVLIKWPQASCLGLGIDGKVSQFSMKEELLLFINELRQADLIIMPDITSLAIDAAIFEIPSMVVYADKSKLLTRQNTSMLIKSYKTYSAYVNLTILDDFDNFMFVVNEILVSDNKSKELASKLLMDWDYPTADFKSLLTDAVFGKI